MPFIVCNKQIKIRDIPSKRGGNISKSAKFCNNEMFTYLSGELRTSSCCHRKFTY